MTAFPHEALDEAERLYHAFMAKFPNLKGDIRKLFRVEFSHEEWFKLLHATTPNSAYDPRDHDAAPKYRGFSLYRVEHLSKPGWRVIGPD